MNKVDNRHGPMSARKIMRYFRLQKDRGDCGVACLQNILEYYGVQAPLERLRDWSGTDSHGTSLLGLCQAAAQMGLHATGAEAERFDNITEIKHPAILHLIIDNRLMHYAVYYPPEALTDHRPGHYLIGDPAKGVRYVQRQELEGMWVTKACLLLSPSEKMPSPSGRQHDKWKWFWPLLREHSNLLYLACFLGLIMAVLNLSTALFSQQLIDKILPAKDTLRLVTGVALFAVLLLLRSAVSYLRQFLLLRQAMQFNTKLTGKFLHDLFRQAKAFFDNRKTGDLVSRLNDTLRIQQAIGYIAGEIGVHALLITVSVVFIFFYAWKIAVAALLLVPVIFLVVLRLKETILHHQKMVMSAQAYNESNYVDVIRGMGAIMAYERQSYFLQKSLGVFTFFQRAIFQMGRTRMKFSVLIELVMVVFLTAVVGWSAAMVLDGQLKTGELIAIIQLATMLFQHSITVALTSIQLQEARVAFDRMYEFSQPALDETEQPAVRGMQAVEIVGVEDLSFRFPGRAPLFEHVSFSARVGQIIAIAGESGCGKSTLLQTLHGLYLPHEGSITVNGRSLWQLPAGEWRQHCALSAQEVALFSGTLAENIALENMADNGQQVIAFCRQYGFDKYFETFPQAYASLLGEGGISLSGGQKQLVGLARCLYRNSTVILLDEPTSAMDAATEQFVTGLLKRLQPQKIIIVISHKDALCGIAGSVYRLDAKGFITQHKNQRA